MEVSIINKKNTQKEKEEIREASQYLKDKYKETFLKISDDQNWTINEEQAQKIIDAEPCEIKDTGVGRVDYKASEILKQWKQKRRGG